MAREDELPDEELIRRLAAHDRRALDALIRRYDRQLVAAIHRLLGRVPDRDHIARGRKSQTQN